MEPAPEHQQPPQSAKAGAPPQSMLLGADTEGGGLRLDLQGRVVSASARFNAALLNKGLHHHGEAPSAAGYSLSELCALACSSFAAQRTTACRLE